jgi:hypothetical protein
MIKFTGSDQLDIEICGAAYNPLPMYLNQQLIKILEDMGVEDDIFLQLQAKAVERLRKCTLTSIDASNFLTENQVGIVTRVPWLIRMLEQLGMPFQMDRFLCNVVEMAVLVELRALKHRSRILVDNGVTLHGIMDETGYLEEGQVFCTMTKQPGMREVIRGSVMISRSPALHPGDVQIAEAVTAPQDSPLNALSNCICFSQKGSRDLPSQLSGGDLDGDLYQIIYEPRMWPKRTYPAADYSPQTPIDIMRPVTSQDMTEFFIEFMENDQLGRIATLHKTLADQMEEGTVDPICIGLAAMHSTAVDFSKTGIPVFVLKPLH